MAELEIDQSNLPRVQEVCQCFAVLEDGVLAHNLQEQEIEQYYTTNIQKNQLVQNDIRVAKRLQDEEEEQRAQQNAVLRQASRQLEEEDFEYARVIQEEIQRCAEEAQRREQDDECPRCKDEINLHLCAGDKRFYLINDGDDVSPERSHAHYFHIQGQPHTEDAECLDFMASLSQCGKSSSCRRSVMELIMVMKQDLQYLHLKFPGISDHLLRHP